MSLRTSPTVPETSTGGGARADRPERSSLPSDPSRAVAIVAAICGVVLFVAARSVWSNAVWLRPFLRDLAGWLADPRIAGPPRMPARPFLGLAILGCAGALGWLSARRLLRDSDLAEERPLVAGLAIASGVCLLGYPAMVATVVGRLSAPFIAGALLVAAAVLLTGEARDRGATRRRSVGTDATLGAPSPRLRRVTVGIAALVLLWTGAHAVLSPVLEWDALAYHAEVARRWFLERPAPALVFGPSIGYEISSNYPPLFSAAGAAMSVLLGRFDDAYLRVLPPLLLLAILLMTFGYARRRLGEESACCSVLLLLGTPLLVMYGAWPTDYILLTAMVLASVILADAAARSGRRSAWVASGVAAGLALLSHVYGLPALAAPVAALLLRGDRRGPRRVGVRDAAPAIVCALAVASPWLLRNLVLLGDPLYPLGSPPFRGAGLIRPLWDASKEQIRNAALTYWEPDGAGLPRLAQAATALFDRHLLPVGLYFGLVLGVASWRRERTLGFLAAVLCAFLASLLLPGAFWLRAILPALPIAAILTGGGFGRLLAAGREARRAGPRPHGLLATAMTRVTAVLVLGAGAATGLALAIAGPTQLTWTTNLGERDELLRAVENLGSPPRQLWTTFGGDVELWRWMDRHVGDGDRVATLEIRTYYLRQPGDLFSLDGRAAAPLLELDTPGEASRFLRGQGVRFLAIPSWSADAVTGLPASGVLPLYDFLGSRWFPAIAVFPVADSGWPSIVYAVGEVETPLVAGVFPGESRPPGDDGSATFAAGVGGMRIAVPAGGGREVALRLTYRLAPGGSATLTLFEGGLPEVVDLEPTSGAEWRTITLRIPRGVGRYGDVRVRVRGADLEVRDLVVVPVR